MLRILKTFAWLRWRMLVNSLELTASRDRLERFSVAIEQLGPIIAAILLIPSALFLFGLGAFAGFTTGQSATRPMPFEAVRYLVAAVPLLALAGPLFLPSADRTNPVRLLLLPIPRATLYVAQTSAGFGDPWTILMVPLVMGVVVGLAVAGALAAALVGLAAAMLLVLVVVGLSSVATSILHLIVRDRRRGELLTLLFIIVVPVLALLPSIMAGGLGSARGKAREQLMPSWVRTTVSRAVAYYPTELYVGAHRAAASGRLQRSARDLAALAAMAVLLHGVGFVTFGRMLDSPGTTGARRAAPMREAWGWRLPGLSTAASAVATAHLRLALRTPRGRSILLSPIAMVVIFGLLISRGSGTMDFGFVSFSGGISLATFASFLALASILPIAMNQFAVDRSGLTMTLLSPLSDEDLLAGKAAGNALIAAPPVVVSLVMVLAVFPIGSPWPWLTLLPALVSIYFIVAPVAAICSAVFPRAVDMNSIGRGSNAHGAAGLIGLATFLGAGVPPLLLNLLARNAMDRPELAPLFVLAWCGVAYVIGRFLFVAARRILVARKENLALVV